MNRQKILAEQIYELSIQFEEAEQAGEPVIALAKRIGDLRDELATLKRDSALPIASDIQREPDGNFLWA